MKSVGIYKVTNLIDGKVYIGQTVNYNKRRRSHRSHLRNGKHHNEHLQRAFDKYGEEFFAIELLTCCKREDLDSLEQRYIKEYDSCNHNKGYNMMYGGQEYRTFTKEVRTKMSRSAKGRKFTEEHKKRIGFSQRGKIISKEAIEKSKQTKRRNKEHWGEKNPNALLTNEIAGEIITDLLEDVPVKEIAAKFDVNCSVVYDLMYNRTYLDVMPEVRKSLITRTFDLLNNKIELAIEMYLEGHSQNKIAKELGMSRNTIRRELQKRDLNTQIHVNQFIKHANTEVSDQITKG